MDDDTIISNLGTILYHDNFSQQFIYFCCGLYNNMDFCLEFRSKGAYFIIGKILSDFKFDICHYINYLMIIIENKQTILKNQQEICYIDTLHNILSGRRRIDFLSFLSGFYSRENWGELEKYGDSYIIGRIIDIREDKINAFCRFLLNDDEE